MPEKPSDTEELKEQGAAPEGSTVARSRSRKWLKILVPILALGAVLLYVPLPNWLPLRLGPGGRLASDRAVGTLFVRVPAEQLFSTDRVLQAVGRSPVDPSKVLFPVFDKSSAPEGRPQEPADAQSTEGSPGPAGDERLSQPQTGTEDPDDREPSASQQTGAPAPMVQSRRPGSPAPGAGAQTKPTEEPASHDAQPDKPSPVLDKSRPEAPAQRFEERGRSGRESARSSRKGGSTADVTPKTEATPKTDAAPTTEPGRTDQYQVPGSLMVKIQNYSGTQPKWGLMVILDDSTSMARKLRIWNPNRLEAGVNLINRLTTSVTAGSKIAVRDFLCKKSDGAASKTTGTCLSHKLYDWHEAPFASLKESLDQLGPAGSTNPCAAAAFALSRDFSGMAGLSPRLLIVTDGAAKCAFHDVIKAAEAQVGKDRLAVDVFALGMHRKRQAGYTKLTQGSRGIFHRIDGPGDVDAALARYGKALQTPIMEKIEVRGGKATMTVTPEEEIPLAPGTYTVLLPAVAGITSSRRTLEGITVRSGEATLVQIKVKKGKPVAKIGKK
jgi:hypothetical protein